MGEEVGAFIRIKDSTKALTREDVEAYCTGKLSHFKIPRYIVFVDEFPRTASGKVQKFAFLECFADKLFKA
jgi:acyl-CoA synthetase (AMP-forming)/AMP-acid ligase II